MADYPKRSSTLFKHRSWTADNDIHRDKEWERLKHNQRRRKLHRRSMSANAASEFDVTDDDIKELRACFELGFRLDPDLDPNLKRVFPALELYAAVNRDHLSRSSSVDSSCSTSSSSNGSWNSSACSVRIVDPSDDPVKVKMRLKRWAQIVACSVYEGLKQPAAATEVVAE